MPKNKKLTKGLAMKKAKGDVIKTKNKMMPASLTTKEIKGQLNAWAHEGTKESIKKLHNFIVAEENKDLREYARLAEGEASYFYYGLQGEKEEKQFLLAKKVKQEEDDLWNLMSRADSAQIELRQLDLDKAVHKRIMKNERYNNNKKEDWKYRFSQDYYIVVKGQLEKIEDDINYKAAWIDEANKMITVKKYKNIPNDVFEHVHIDGEEGSFWVDEPWKNECRGNESEEDACRNERDDCGCGSINPEDIPF